jgi:ubiquinone biosynthesis monooxygenase Coq7
VVLRHLEQQLNDLRGIDEAAVMAISAIVVEERLHHDQAAAHVAESSLWSRVLNPVVSSATEAVIWVGMRA